VASHEPVLLAESLALLAVRPDATVVDATLGRAGHARAILERLGPEGVLFGLDRDPDAVAFCREALVPSSGGPRVVIAHGTFRELLARLAEAGLPRVDALLADLGLSSPQLDEPRRGFSFRGDGPLDMRADSTRGETARDLLARLDETALADVIYRLGEERQSRRIARAIHASAVAGHMETTAQLRDAVHRAVRRRPRGGIDPATRTFQAIRIAVNDELGELDALLAALPDLLTPGGRAVILSYHSLEDRRVKQSFRGDDRWQSLTKKPVVATAEECARNPRARSAKLRGAERRAAT
jgi:16S rRNA (cytosine1402-N4)-methyltransferase